MTLTPPTPRVRRRLGLYDFDHAVGSGVRNQQAWIDRLKFGLPGVVLSVACSADTLRNYLESRREGLFNVECPAPHRLIVTFEDTKWFFRLQINLSFSDARWAGAASLELNPSRLFARVAENHDLVHNLDRTPQINRQDLLIGLRGPSRTLDGKDNFVPPYALAAAINANWPILTQCYADAVRSAITECLGTAHQFVSGVEDNAQCFVRLPPCSAWTLKEVEAYYEFRDEDAPLRVAAISGMARGLAALFSEDDHGGYGAVAVPGIARHANMPSVRLGLGIQDVYLAIYAKAADRVRLEVRYKRHPISRGCRATSDQFTSNATAVQDMMVVVIANATRRANAFLRACHRHQGGRAAGLFPLVTALTAVIAAAGNGPRLLNRVLTLLIVHGGLSRSDDPSLQGVLDALVRSNVLIPANIALRCQSSEFTLAPAYAESFRHLRETGFHHYR